MHASRSRRGIVRKPVRGGRGGMTQGKGLGGDDELARDFRRDRKNLFVVEAARWVYTCLKWLQQLAPIWHQNDREQAELK